MFPKRQLFRLGAQLRTPIVRTTIQRRFASSAGSNTENAFLREREAVKAHAAATSGERLI
jgi:cytochrome c oxidase subunit 6a